MNTMSKRLGAGFLTALTLTGTTAGVANAWQEEYKNDAAGVSTPVPPGFIPGSGDTNANTGVAFYDFPLANGVSMTYNSLGSFWNNESNTILWCIDYGTPFAGVGGDPTSIENTTNAAITNYIITKYEGDRTPRNHAAIAYAVHVLNDHMSAQWMNNAGVTITSQDFFNNLAGTELGDIAQRGQEMIDEARANVGPYTIETTIDPVVEGKTYSIFSETKSASGNKQFGFNETHTLEGPAVFDLNGDGVVSDGDGNTITIRSGDGIPTVLATDGGKGGTISVRSVVDNLPGDSIKIWDGAGQSQTMMAKGGASAAVEATDSIDVAPATETYTPKVTTQTSHNWAAPGTKITDKISVTGNKDGNPLTVTSTLWFSEKKPELSDKVPADAVKVGSVETKVTGNGEFTTPALTVDKVGYYVWTESIPETPIPGAPAGSVTKAWQGKYGVSTEITPVGDVTTKASADIVKGATIYDTAIVKGIVPEGAYLTFDLYKISDKNLTDEEVEKGDFTKQFVDANKVWSSTKNVPVNGAGEYKSETFKPTEAGTYSYVETLRDKGGKILKQGKKGAGSESVIVYGNVTTKASPDVIVGNPIYDTAIVDGITPEGAYLKFDLYKISDERLTDEQVEKGDFTKQFVDANKVWSSTKNTPVNGAGEYKSETFVPTEDGTYSYVETLYDKDGKVLKQGKKGAGSESVIVYGNVTTKASADIVKGGTIYDTAIVDGITPEGAYLTFDLYKISDERLTDEEIEKGDFTKQFVDANKVWSSTKNVPVNGAGEYKSETFKPTEDGTYSYVETLRDKDGKVLKQGKKGAGSESVIVYGNVTTKASEDVVLGKAIHDTAIVDGITPEGAYLTFDLYKISDKVVSDAEVDKGGFADQFTDANKVWSSTDKVLVDGAGEYKSAEFTPSESGTYSYVETLRDKDGKILKQGKKGVGSESVVVFGTVTTKASEDVYVGSDIFDTATVEGAIPEGAYLKFDLYKISDKSVSDEEIDKGGFADQFTDANKVWSSTKETPVNGAGEYKSETFKPTEAGTYSYVETLYDKDGNIISQGKKGVGSESVIVKEKPVPPAPKPVTPQSTPTPEPTPMTPAPVTPAKADTGGSVDAGSVLTGVGIMSVLGGAIGAVFARRHKKN